MGEPTSASGNSTLPRDLRSVSPPTATSAVPAVKLAVAEKHIFRFYREVGGWRCAAAELTTLRPDLAGDACP